ncbi:MAG: M24 family metallopeptidase [Pseudomonadota bacterium]
MNRRDALGLLAASSSVAMFGTVPLAAQAAPATSDLPAPLLGPRMNFAQADKVMKALGLDALILATGLNFQYATGIRPVISRMGYPPSALAIVKRGEKDRLAIVGAAFSYYYTMADMHDPASFPAYLYTAPVGTLADGEDAGAAPLYFFPDREEAPVDAIEQHRIDASKTAVREQGDYATMSDALRAALRDHGLSKARIATDHPRAQRLLTQAAPAIAAVDADDALRRIRPVKSDVEIELMRHASAGNVVAAHEALQIVRAGGSYRDLRAAFFAAAARRGQHGVFMVIDRTSDEQYDGTFRDGQAFLIDCVSEYQSYHGDYGRTVFVGEPPKPMRQATTAMGDAWDRVREKLRPGLALAEITAMGKTALRNANKRYNVSFGPHSVGLFHTDHTGSTGLPPRTDMVLEPGMIISVDCPLLETGVGGSAHLEDLMLITADGAEPINPIDQQTITV